MILNVSLPGQVEIGMVGQVAKGIFVTDGAVADAQVVLGSPADADGNAERSGKAFFAVRAGIGKGYHITVFSLMRLCMPHLTGKAVAAAVKAVDAFICIYMIHLAIDGEGSTADAVAYASDCCADGIINLGIIRGAVKAQSHIGQCAAAIGNTDGNDPGAVVRQAKLGTGCIGQGVKRGGTAIGKRAEGGQRNAYTDTSEQIL